MSESRDIDRECAINMNVQRLWQRRGLILISGVSELRQSVIVRFVVAAGGGGGSQPRSPSWPSRRDREQFCCHA